MRVKGLLVLNFFSKLTFFVLMLLLVPIAVEAYLCKDYFEIQDSRSHYLKIEKDLDQILSPEFLSLKNNPRELAEYIREIVGYSPEAVRTTHVPYFAAVIPHFIAILDQIPRESAEKAISLIHLHKRELYQEIQSLDLFRERMESYQKGVSILDFNKVVMITLLLEHIHIDRKIYNYEHMMIDTISRFQFRIHDNIIKQGIIPIIMFNFHNSKDFKLLWKHGLSPISIEDSIVGPYDGNTLKFLRTRFMFANHDIGHARGMASIVRNIRIPQESFATIFRNPLKIILNNISPPTPKSAIFSVARFIKRTDEYIASLEDKSEREFINNFMWWMIHESDPRLVAEIIVISNSYTRKRDRIIANFINNEIIDSISLWNLSEYLTSSNYSAWLIPKELKNRIGDNDFFAEKISNYLMYVTDRQ